MAAEAFDRFRLGPAWRAARLAARLRRRGARVRKWTRQKLRRKASTRAEWPILTDGTPESYARRPVRELADALRLCVSTGCHDTAARLAVAVFDGRSRLEGARRTVAMEDVVTSLLWTGDEAALASLVSEAANELPGCTLDKLRAFYPELAAAPPARPGHRLGEPLLLHRAVERGELTARDLLRLLERHAWQHAQNPELDLVLYNALRSDASGIAAAALARYFDWHGLEAPLTELAAEFPRGFRFRESRPARQGPPVSMVMAAFRARETVTSAIDSLLAQSYRPLEILVCDDVSDDATLELLVERYGAEPAVRIFSAERRQGPYNIRNALLPHCRGELIAFHDADDLALPSRVARQVAELGRTQGHACYSNWLRIRENGAVVFFWDDAASRLCLPSLMITRRAVTEVPAFRPARFGADLEHRLALERVFGPAAMARLRLPLILGRWSAGSLTRSSGSESLESGYRAPARRAYADVVGRRALLGPDHVPDAMIDEVLRRHDILIEPSPVREVAV